MFPLDRADGKKYQRRYTQNACPTLTTNNSYLFVASLDFKKSDQDRKFFRFLDPSERMNLQGFAGATLKEASDALRVKASGNAYPAPLMIAVLHPILKQLQPQITNTVRVTGSLSSEACTTACSKFDKFMEECSKAGPEKFGQTEKKMSKAKAKPSRTMANAKAKSKARAKVKATARAKGQAKAKTKVVKKSMKKGPSKKALEHYKYRFMSSSSS